MAKSIFIVHFDVVQGCQLLCVGCPNSTIRAKVRQIPVDDFSRVLGNLDVDKIHTLRLFNFGEALLHRELARLVALIPEQKWKVAVVEISTNAQHVYWDDFEDMLKLQVVNRLVVSCDGDGTPESYERTRPPAKWAKLIEFLERTQALRDRHCPSMQLVTRSICDPEPAENRQRWRDVLEPRGWKPEFRRWQFFPESSENKTGRKLKVPEGACFFMANSLEFPKAWDGEMNLLGVDIEGIVRPCCFHPKAGDLGNLLTQTYSEVLAGRQRSDFIAALSKDRASMPVCSSCDVGPLGNEGPSFFAGMDR